MSKQTDSGHDAGMPQVQLEQLLSNLRLEEEQNQTRQRQLAPQGPTRNPAKASYTQQLTTKKLCTALFVPSRLPTSLHPSLTPQLNSVDAAYRGFRQLNASPQHLLVHDSIVCNVCYSWNGEYLATASNLTANLFYAKNGHKIAIFAEHTALPFKEGISYGADSCYVRAVCFTPDDLSLVAGGEDCIVRVWEIYSRKLVHRLVGHGADVSSVDASSNNQFIASGSGDGQVKVWCLATGTLLTTLGADCRPPAGITSVSVSPTCRHVAAGSLDGVVRVWELESGALVRQLKDHTHSVYSVAFSADGSRLLSGSLDRTLKLWDLGFSSLSSQSVLTFEGHEDFVLAVAFRPDEKWLISGSKDRTVRLWEPRQPTVGLEIRGHDSSVIGIAHHPASSVLASGGGDGYARIWSYSL